MFYYLWKQYTSFESYLGTYRPTYGSPCWWWLLLFVVHISPTATDSPTFRWAHWACVVIPFIDVAFFNRIPNDVKVGMRLEQRKKTIKQRQRRKENPHKSNIWENKFLFIIWSLFFYYLELNMSEINTWSFTLFSFPPAFRTRNNTRRE